MYAVMYVRGILSCKSREAVAAHTHWLYRSHAVDAPSANAVVATAYKGKDRQLSSRIHVTFKASTL